MPEFSVTPGFIVLLAAFVLVCEGGLLLCGLAAVGVHELGHMLALWAMGAGVERVRFTLFGGEILPAHPLRLSPAGELCVLACGPLTNLVLAAGGALAGAALPWGYVLAGVSLSLALVNLLPVPGLDGGRMLALCCPPGALKRAAFAAGLVLCVAGCLLLCSEYRNPTLLLFGAWSIFRAFHAK